MRIYNNIFINLWNGSMGNNWTAIIPEPGSGDLYIINCPPVNKKSFIVNDVNEAFELHADEQVLAFIIGNLLSNAISSSDHVCIRLEAVKEPKGIQIRVKNNGANFYSTGAHGFSEVLAAARSMGASINIYNQKHEGLMITLTMAA